MLFQQVEHRFALCQDFGAVTFGRGGIVAEIGQQFRLGHRAARVLRHDLDLLAGRDLLQLDEFGQQPPDRDRLADRQLRAAAFRDLQPDLVGRQEAEAAGDGIDQRRIVARHHAEVIADAIADAGRQLHLDMPGRAVRRVGAGLVLQFAVDQHLHRRDAADRDDRVDRGRRHRLDVVERLVVGAAAEIASRPNSFTERGRLGEPAFELAVEIAAGVALAARIDAAAAMRGQLLVDHARDRLIGRGPVAVAAAEHRVAQFCEGIFRQVARRAI